MNETNRQSMKARKRKKRKKRLLIMIPFLFLITIIAGITVYGAYLTNKAATAATDSQKELDRGEKSDKRAKAVDPAEDNISVLFLGIDDSETRGFGGATRSDAMILATFNEKEKSVKMVSIPRDSYVYLPRHGEYDKITHAHAFDGIDGAVDTVEALFDIPVDYYVRMNFDAFIEVIDALDGVKVDVPFTFREQDSQDRKGAIKLEKGIQTLDGEEALAFVRMRKLDNDIERGKRQQQVLKAIIEKAASAKSITKYGDVIDAVGDNLTTNMSFNEMVALHDYATAGSKLTVETYTLEGEPSTERGTWTYEVDSEALDELIDTLKGHLKLDMSASISIED